MNDPEAWRYDPTMIPEFIEEPDGFYNRKIVIQDDIKAGWIMEIGSAEPVAAIIGCRIVECRIPRTKTTLKWKEVWDE